MFKRCGYGETELTKDNKSKLSLEERLDKLITYMEFWNSSLNDPITLSYLKDLKNNTIPNYVFDMMDKINIVGRK